MQKQATENMKKEFTKIWYVVYADIHGNFDKMNLEILLELLKCRISDRRHVKLCRQCYSQNYWRCSDICLPKSESKQGKLFSPTCKSGSNTEVNGGIKILGILTVADSIAQMAAMLYFELNVVPVFYKDSYGHRPNKTAIQALEVTRMRCRRKDWVLEFDIRGLLDNISIILWTC